jgi:hypothetical protein
VSTHPPRRLLVRPAQGGDAQSLDVFRCSTGPWYEQEVEGYVRSRALAQALENPGSYRLLLVLEGGVLIACLSHHLEMMLRDRGNGIVAARLHVLAISIEHQGRRLAGGTRLSDIVMATLIADALEIREVEVATAIVARDNLRSIALCERNGLRSQVRYDGTHIRLSGRLGPRGGPPCATGRERA